jgi:3-hydroxybutyryl-CoA dehydrogenase
MSIKKVLVLGSGLMGSGIAQVCAQAGIQVSLNDVSQEALDRAVKNIAWSVGKLIEKGALTEDKETITGRIQQVNDFSTASDADLVIEAVFEILELKRPAIRRQLQLPNSLR